MVQAQRKLCVLFADVSGSTRLHEKLGDKEARHAVERCINRMTRVTEMRHGRVVKTLGDELMAVFAAAEDGLQAACEMQQRVADLPPVSGVKLSIRVGLHHGAVTVDGDDVSGDTVNTAARMAGLAQGGQIITTGDTVDLLPPLLRPAARDIDALTVNGPGAQVRVCEVLWQQGAELTVKPAGISQAPAPSALRVRHGGREFLVNPERGILTMGRDQGNDILITDRRASRRHARIERRRDKFVVIDQSTNGTYVLFDGGAEFVLKREEAILRGRGRISFGHGYVDDGRDVVEFQVVG
ncbi:MAG: adenylate/guanylate cyclase domain-containing protein [Pseudomonadota bacterium]